MIRIIFAILALVFVQLVNGQDACTTAQTNLASNTACTTAIGTGDLDNICMETCRNLLNALVSSCDPSSEIAMDVATLISYCDSGTTTACLTAGQAIDDSCSDYLDTANPATLCSGTCNTQLSAVAAACEDSTDPDIQLLVSAYNTACNSDAQCQAALAALNADGDCLTALENNDTATYCSGSCEDLIIAVLNTCPDNAFIESLTRSYFQDCGTPCQMAIFYADESCITYVDTANPVVCSGTCNTQVSAVAAACEDSTDPDIQLLVSAYNTACNSDAQCQAALAALNADGDCLTALENNDTATYCLGSCEDLIIAVLNTCPDNAFIESQTRSYFQGCGTPCQMAIFSVDESCITYVDTANPVVCSGTCNTQVSAAVTTCATDSDGQVFVAAYNTACNSGDQCTAALVTLNADDDCVTALNNNETTTYCSGSCADLINAAYDVCPENAFLSRAGYNQNCGIGTGTGTGSGSVIIQASGIVTLLLAAMCALLF